MGKRIHTVVCKGNTRIDVSKFRYAYIRDCGALHNDDENPGLAYWVGLEQGDGNKTIIFNDDYKHFGGIPQGETVIIFLNQIVSLLTK